MKEECCKRNRKHTNELTCECKATVSCVEESTSKDTPNTTDTVDGDRTNWVVNLDLIEEDDRENDDDTSDQTNDNRTGS